MLCYVVSHSLSAAQYSILMYSIRICISFGSIQCCQRYAQVFCDVVPMMKTNISKCRKPKPKRQTGDTECSQLNRFHFVVPFFCTRLCSLASVHLNLQLKTKSNRPALLDWAITTFSGSKISITVYMLFLS